jgi:hypothetical protein
VPRIPRHLPRLQLYTIPDNLSAAFYLYPISIISIRIAKALSQQTRSTIHHDIKMSSRRPHHRFLHVPRLTGLRRPSQSAATTSHGKAQLVVDDTPEEAFHRPTHYHAYSTPAPTYHQHDNMPQPRQQQQPRVRFADDPHHNRTNSSSTASTSSPHSNPVSASSSRSSFELEPTSVVAEWCHQMHIMQSRRYDWCQACYPRAVQQVAAPTEEEVTMAMIEARRAQMVERLRREREAGHAYQ